ncbi:MAG: [FeFe] hydrogenase H-cluster radical SAM maturase HydE [Eubacteriales bacterium]|jgi:biotin synthase|nr:[FeFe] hydrogenase H-cluster radical SAM maturase HydE [Bacillota bacterium]MBV1727383.1 [FeFe] hydrogenase H-cluster radical SAM maturase HydE [Desulforudis sp.]MDZ4042790.1 [FeFe] hydrogenase H-cluster radical SAM maturase HydE [Eubacteriales bacterium]MBU4533815.1 [FeFe] hydrogenase H-cluster radical SAM maturase HydE [Bacillota bacterium]MBU4555008.1 [FeFe] hydrogenase H-cluster radical SAM maturase HydE [Bacillota bacterium]
MPVELTVTLTRAVNTHTLTREEMDALLQTEGEQAEALYRAADQVRAEHLGKEVHLRAIIEFSNYCVRNCLYCGLRRDNRLLTRYRMAPEEILAAARQARDEGYRSIVLQSGEDPAYTVDDLAGLIQRIKEKLDVAVTLSLGDRSRDDYRRLRDAGADRYLLKHETADPALFARLRPGTTLERRLQELRWLEELGYQVGAGNMIGLPGQTVETLVSDILLLKDLCVEMAGIGPFIPHPDTPLATSPAGSLEMTLKALAVTRLLLPYSHIPATTAVATLDPAGRRRALRAGANIVMPDLTPAPYRQHYAIYPGRGRPAGERVASFAWWEREMAAIGRKVATGYGHAFGVHLGSGPRISDLAVREP